MTTTSADEIRQHALDLLSRKGVFHPTLHRQIEGVCSTERLDSQGSTLDPDGMTYEMPVPLLVEHRLIYPIGLVKEIKGPSIIRGPAIRFVARLADGLPWSDEIWEQVKSGAIDCTSVRYDRFERDYSQPPRFHIAKWNLAEISIVPNGSNADAKIHLVREVERPDAIRLDGSKHERVFRDVRAQYQHLLPEWARGALESRQ